MKRISPRGALAISILFLLLPEPVVAEGEPTELSVSHFATGKRPTRLLHVDTAAKPDGTGSKAKPFRRIRDAVAKATPGTGIRIHPGTYPGGTWIQDLAGTAAAPIWIGGVPGQKRPILAGGKEGLHLSQVRYLVLHHLEVRGTQANGVNCDDGGRYADPHATQFVVFEALHIHDIGGTGNQDGLKLSGVNDYWIQRCRIQRCGGRGSGSGIDQVGCHRGQLVGNVIEDCSGNGIQCKGGCMDIEIRANRLIRPGARGVNLGGSTGFAYFRPRLSSDHPQYEATRISVFSNLIVGGATAVAFVGCVDCVVAQNTIVDPETWIFRILQETRSRAGYEFGPSAKGRFLNNLVWFSRKRLRTEVNVGGGTSPESFKIANNLWYAHDQPNASTPRLPVPEQGGIHGKHPGIRPPEFHGLAMSSPATGKGLRFPGSPKTDLDGQPFRKQPSIGAYEVR